MWCLAPPGGKMAAVSDFVFGFVLEPQTHRQNSRQTEGLDEADGLRGIKHRFIWLLDGLAVFVKHFHLFLVVAHQRPVAVCVRLHWARSSLQLYAQT